MVLLQPAAAVEVGAAFLRRAAAWGVPQLEASIGAFALFRLRRASVVLGPAEGPLVVQGPHQGLRQTADLLHRESGIAEPVQVKQIRCLLLPAGLQFRAQPGGEPGMGMEHRVGAAESAIRPVPQPWRQTSPQPAALLRGRAVDHRGIAAEFLKHPQLRLHSMGLAVIDQTAMDPVGGTGGSTGAVGRIDVENVQPGGLSAASSLPG